MYGSMNKSWPQKITIVAAELLFLLLAYWFLFRGGNAWFHLPAGDFNRSMMLFTFCLVTFIRMSYMVVYLLRRGVKWGEVWGILLAFAVYYVGFSMLGGTNDKPLDWIDGIAVLVFLVGSAINTVSEMLRHQWKKLSENEGKLYTGGLFKYAIHINYFGDMVWVSGFALLTRVLGSGLIPFCLLLMFVVVNIPVHDRYLRDKYGAAFINYEKETKKLIPFVY